MLNLWRNWFFEEYALTVTEPVFISIEPEIDRVLAIPTILEIVWRNKTLTMVNLVIAQPTLTSWSRIHLIVSFSPLGPE